MYHLLSCAEGVPQTWLAPGHDQSPSSLLPAWYQFWSFRAAPPSQFRRRRRTDHGEGFLPSQKCLGAPSAPTPLNGYTSTLLCCHSCRHGRSSIRLQVIHMNHCERLVSFPAQDDRPLSNTLVMSTGPNHGNCSFVPRVCSNVMS